MPKAHAAYEAAQARIPRTLFGHAHESGSNVFPPSIVFSETARMHILTPDNWNGLDKLELWLFDDITEQKTIDVTINIGSEDELFNVHTQTVAATIINIIANEYECIDLTALFAVVLANLATRDMIQVLVTHAGGDEPIQVFGIEAQET